MKKTIAYWIVTGLFCSVFTMAGIMNLIHAAPQVEAITGLGYPEYLLTFLGVAKLLGVCALLTPRLPKLKEWAYAGFTFDMLGASFSHGANGDPAMNVIIPLVILGVGAASYLLRPVSRREPE